MHLTCTNQSKEVCDAGLAGAKEAGICNIVALRGDPPKGQDKWEVTEGGFACALDLVKYMRTNYGDYFSIQAPLPPRTHNALLLAARAPHIIPHAEPASSLTARTCTRTPRLHPERPERDRRAASSLSPPPHSLHLPLLTSSLSPPPPFLHPLSPPPLWLCPRRLPATLRGTRTASPRRAASGRWCTSQPREG